MAQPPTGTVTFLFTDIEGSTRLWEERPDEMRLALAAHDTMLRSMIEAHGGYVFSTGGDGFAVAFQRAADAIDAAAEGQAALSDHEFLRVRMGLHTGEVHERDGDYFGPAVNRAARIMAAGHGGQVLVSAATAGVADVAGLVDLGLHSFAGLSVPERVFQFGMGAFPPLRSIGAAPSNLPTERSVFVGRERELGMVASRVRSSRMVTLTGVGGVGKTRLAVQTAAGLVDEFPGGVWLVELAPLIDAALVASAVASAVGAPPSPGLAPADVVCRFLAHKRALVVLDNCEHVIDTAAALVDQLLSAAPRVRVLATSREPLDVAGESVWRVPSLTVDAPDGALGDAVALFVERAAHVRGGFALDDANRDAVLAVCRRLDGIPLAIELAAARARVMSVEQIAARLDERFRLLTRGGRTAVARQQTLQGAIDWSYELLAQSERELFDTLGVFAGEFDLVAAAAVAGVEEFEVLDLIEQLVDKSMLEADPTRDRYRLLETLRQYAWDRLIATDRLGAARDAHAAHYATVADEQAALMRVAGRQVEALDRLEVDYDNLRAALMHVIEQRDADAAVRLVRRLGGLFNIRHPREGFGWFQQIIAIADELPAKTRARLLGDAAQAAMTAGDLQMEARLAQEAVDIGGADAPAIAHWQLASLCLWKGELTLSIEHAQRAFAAAVATTDLTAQTTATGALVMAFAGLGDEPATRRHLPELIELAERLGNPTITATYYATASSSLAHLGHLDEAIALCTKGLAHADAGGPITAAYVRTIYAMEIDDPTEGARLLLTAIPIAKNQLWGHFQWDALVPAAKIIKTTGRPELATLLLGTYTRYSDESGFYFDRYTDQWADRLRHQLTDTLGQDVFDEHLQRGNQLPIEQALHLALDAINQVAKRP